MSEIEKIFIENQSEMLQRSDISKKVVTVPVRSHVLQPLPAPGNLLLVLEHIGGQRHLADHLGWRKGHLIPRENAGGVGHAFFRKLPQYLPKVTIQGLRLLPPLVEILQTRRHGLSDILQIGNNLLSNAIKFTDNGSVSLAADYDNGLLKLIVEDTGKKKSRRMANMMKSFSR